MATVPGVRLLPNAITVLALCSGLSAVAFALRGIAAPSGSRGQWFAAIAAIGVAAILDSIDGPAARLLNSTSRIGAELDSLSDLVSFGVAPALLIYIWKFDDGSGIGYGWAFCLLFAVCTALRLARFNSLLEDAAPKPYAQGFFTGVPAPAAGLLSTVPMLIWIRFGEGFWTEKWVVALWLTLIAMLAVSRLPTVALKSLRVPPSLIVPLLALLVVAVALEFYEPQIVLAIGLGLYLLHLPYASWKFQYLKRHPELWMDATQLRLARSSTRRIRLSVRMPRRRRVAGRAPDGSPLPLARRRGALGQVRGRVQGRRRPR